MRDFFLRDKDGTLWYGSAGPPTNRVGYFSICPGKGSASRGKLEPAPIVFHATGSQRFNTPLKGGRW